MEQIRCHGSATCKGHSLQPTASLAKPNRLAIKYKQKCKEHKPRMHERAEIPPNTCTRKPVAARVAIGSPPNLSLPSKLGVGNSHAEPKLASRFVEIDCKLLPHPSSCARRCAAAGNALPLRPGAEALWREGENRDRAGSRLSSNRDTDNTSLFQPRLASTVSVVRTVSSRHC